MSPDRLRRAAEQMRALDVDALLIGPGADLRYLSGYAALPLERMTLLVARADDIHTLIVPELERPRAEAMDLPDDLEVRDFAETQDPVDLVASACAPLGPSPRLGVGDRLWATFLLAIQHALPTRASYLPASTVTRELRMRKGPEEIDALRRAGQAIDRVHARVPGLLRPGRTEAAVGADIADLILAEGHEQVSFVIVGSGPNGASPHHELSDRALEPGDAVVVDIGGTLDGYGSDCTRDYLVGHAPLGYMDIHATLEAAQQAACDIAAPGVTAEAVDAAARDVLNEAGLGGYFIHRTGHGIGLEEHEEPYIVAGNELPLEPTMTFSIEPGVYLPDRFGMRIEDIVVVTHDGIERLNTGERRPVPAG